MFINQGAGAVFLWSAESISWCLHAVLRSTNFLCVPMFILMMSIFVPNDFRLESFSMVSLFLLSAWCVYVEDVDDVISVPFSCPSGMENSSSEVLFQQNSKCFAYLDPPHSFPYQHKVSLFCSCKMSKPMIDYHVVYNLASFKSSESSERSATLMEELQAHSLTLLDL